MSVTLRLAQPGDLFALAALYNYYVLNSHCTFDTEPVPLSDRQAWLETHQETGPHRLYVALDHDQVVGYAGSSPFHQKPVYDSSVELSVYVHADHLNRGIGRSLYQKLIRVLEQEPVVHRLYAGITLPNEASLALHESLGFKQAGRFAEVAHKGGRFWDLVWLERAA
ncbi:MAG: N-acetyltransferase family protein [Myxococcota bacterium]